MLLKGDSLVELKKIKDETVDMVYLDPPFYTQTLTPLVYVM